MQVGVADVRRRLKELIDLVAHGELVTITRRGTVIAVLGPPTSQSTDQPLAQALRDWRREWDVDRWPDDEPFADTRDPAPGRRDPW